MGSQAGLDPFTGLLPTVTGHSDLQCCSPMTGTLNWKGHRPLLGSWGDLREMASIVSSILDTWLPVGGAVWAGLQGGVTEGGLWGLKS